jgi:hypothetical protein
MLGDGHSGQSIKYCFGVKEVSFAPDRVKMSGSAGSPRRWSLLNDDNHQEESACQPLPLSRPGADFLATCFPTELLLSYVCILPGQNLTFCCPLPVSRLFFAYGKFHLHGSRQRSCSRWGWLGSIFLLMPQTLHLSFKVTSAPSTLPEGDID